jgi:S-adenosylmethionine synthetase
MNRNTFSDISFSEVYTKPTIETVEKKGIGHPDVLADAVAEEVSLTVSNYFLKKYGFIPRYNTDQVSINGGIVDFGFGSGKVVKKATITIVGNMPYLDRNDHDDIFPLAENSIFSYLSQILSLDSRDLFQINWQTKTYSLKNGTFFDGGASKSHKSALAEDTVVACGFHPYSELEHLTIDINDKLQQLSSDLPIGSDTKIMSLASGTRGSIEFIVSIGFKALEIRDYDEYELIKEKVRAKLDAFIKDRTGGLKPISVRINAADSRSDRKGYYLFSGSASEHDKGQSGKGNRLSGINSTSRRNSFETVFGKNPVYHTGKLYNVLSFLAARRIADEIRRNVEIIIISQLGNPIHLPKAIDIATKQKLSASQRRQITDIIKDLCNHSFKTSNNYPNLMKISEDVLNLGNLTRFRI